MPLLSDVSIIFPGFPCNAGDQTLDLNGLAVDTLVPENVAVVLKQVPTHLKVQGAPSGDHPVVHNMEDSVYYRVARKAVRTDETKGPQAKTSKVAPKAPQCRLEALAMSLPPPSCIRAHLLAAAKPPRAMRRMKLQS